MTDMSGQTIQTTVPTDAPAAGGGVGGRHEKPSSLGRDAWIELRRKPLFIISMIIILLVLLMAAFPQLFTSVDPNHQNLDLRSETPHPGAIFGNDILGQDIYSRVVYGARASIVVGLLSTIGTVLLGSVVGLICGYYGGWADSLLSRVGEVFVGLPFILGAIVILTTFNTSEGGPSEFRLIVQVVLTITVLVWPVSMRIMRATTISAKQQDYVQAARGLGASTFRIITKHLLPNAVAPVLVYATIALGAFIGLEATLAYLGVGLRAPTVSWGVMISDSSTYVRTAPHMLLFPAGFVTLTVLAFVMLGDAVRDALDPKSR
jgi:oligopeptide transport system permease protein